MSDSERRISLARLKLARSTQEVDDSELCDKCAEKALQVRANGLPGHGVTLCPLCSKRLWQETKNLREKLLDRTQYSFINGRSKK